MNNADSFRKPGSTPSQGEGEDSLIVKRSTMLPRLGRYRIVSELASGGMAQVYLAVADGLEKLVALKVVHAHLAREEHFVHMFLDEARIASGIRHRNVCNVFDYGVEDGHYYMAMDFLAGRTLREVMRRLRGKRTTSPELCAFLVTIIADAADGLHAAHELRDSHTGEPLSVIHRDVSPHNIFVGFDGQASVIDFGIAQAEGRLSSTATGVLKGKFSYMAPEQIRDKNVDRRVDVWALGVCLWEALTQRRLFARDAQAETLMSVMSEAIKPPSEARPGLWPELDAIVLKALTRDLSSRYPSTRELARDLRSVLRGRAMLLSPDDLEQQMLQLFPTEAAESEQLVRRARSVSFSGISPVSAELLLGQRRATSTGTGLRPVTLGDQYGDEPSVVLTPASGSLTPALALPSSPASQAVPVPVSLPALSDLSIPDGVLGSAHPSRIAAAPTRRRIHAIVLGALALAAGAAATAVIIPRSSVPAPSASAPLREAAPAVAPSGVPAPAPSGAASAAADVPRVEEPAPSPREAVQAAQPSRPAAKPVTSAPAARRWVPPARHATPSPSARAHEDADHSAETDASAARAEARVAEVRAEPEPMPEPVAPPPRREPLAAPAPAPLAAPAPRSEAAPVEVTYRGAQPAFSVSQLHGALGSSTILRTLARGAAQVEACAAPSAQLRSLPGPLHASLTIDESGHVRQVSVAKHAAPGLGACVQAALGKLRSDQKPDVGTVSAEIEISFRAR
jgi:eukaryotic-like serine/threonine-protein kinase